MTQTSTTKSGAWPFVLTVFAASRILFLAAGALAAAYLPQADPAGEPLEPPGFLGYWAHWDGAWYSEIATEGYGARAPAYRGGPSKEELAEAGVLLATERAERRPAIRQQVEACFAALKRTFGLDETLATTLVGLVTRVAAKVTAYTYGLYVNRLLGRPRGRIKDLWA